MKIKSNFKFTRDKVKDEDLKHIEFRKNKVKRRATFAVKATFVITITVSSTILVLSCVERYKNHSNAEKENEAYIAQLNFSKRFNDNINTSFFDDVSESAVVVSSGDIEEIGLFLRGNEYVISSTKALKDKDNIYIKISDNEQIKGNFIGDDLKTGVAVIKIDKNEKEMYSHSRSFNFHEREEEGQRARFMDNELHSEKIIICDNNVEKKAKFIDVRENNNSKQSDSGIVICDDNGKILGVNFINGKKGIQDFFYSALHTYQLEDIIEKIINQNYTIVKNIGIIGKNAVPSTKGGLKGIYIQRVIKDSSSQEAGIRPTDIIIGFNHEEVTNMDQLGQKLNKLKVNDEVLIKLFRNGDIIYRRIKIK